MLATYAGVRRRGSRNSLARAVVKMADVTKQINIAAFAIFLKKRS